MQPGWTRIWFPGTVEWQIAIQNKAFNLKFGCDGDQIAPLDLATWRPKK